jgi:hypothetical protein
MYLRNLISSLPTKKSGTYIRKILNDSVKNFERLKICGLEIVCSIEILWAIHDCGCHSVGMSPELLRTFFAFTRMSKCSYLRTMIPPIARRSSLNLCPNQDLETKINHLRKYLRNFSRRSFVHTATEILRLIIVGKVQRRRILGGPQTNSRLK